MRAFTRRAAGAFFLAASLLISGPAARADELLVMPYACAMIGGRPMLSPAPEQSHRIIGPREQRSFTACSPANPEMCRTWTVHRFDLDCEGTRVPWVSVVGAAAEQANRRAWVEDGRLLLRMPPSWSFAPDDPCARGPELDDRFGFGRMRRYCADRRAMAPPLVEMPLGFAPMLGIDGIFVRAAPSASTAPLPPPPVAAAPPPPKFGRIEPPQPPPRSEPAPPREPAARDVPAKAPPAPQVAIQPPPQVTPPPPQVAIQPPPQVTPPPAQVAKPPAAPPPPAATPGGPVIPKIINRPEAAAVDPPRSALPTTEVPKTVPPGSDPAPKVAAGPPPKDLTQQDTPAPARTTAEAEDKAITVSLLSVVRSPATGAVIIFVGLTLGLLAAFALARRRERMRLAGTKRRDFASVSLDGRARRAKPVARLGYARGQVPPNAAAATMNRMPIAGQGMPAGSSVPSHWGDRVPQTRAEALQVLGVGVTPDANEVAIKKMVDGLRMSWHPDLAKDEPDRHLRELRLKQINAAWEILQERRVEV